MLKEMYEFIDVLKSHDLDKSGLNAAIEDTLKSGITVNDGPVAFSYVPMLVTKEDMKDFDEVIVGIQNILRKMTREYVDNEEYRKVFGFSKDMEKLICMPCDYEEIIPFGRYDIFYDFETKDYGFCEINTDGSGGMSWNDSVTSAILNNFAGQDYLKEKKIELIDSVNCFADAIIDVYRSSKSAVDDPLIAIVDFKEEGVMTDFNKIIDSLKERRIRARFTDVRDLIFDGEVLKDKNDGEVIHGIYRRIVTSVMLDRMDECYELIKAVENGKVVLMGHFRTSLAHSKKVFAAMYHPATHAFLNDEDIDYIRKHIPETYCIDDGVLSDEQFEDAIKNRDEWVLKPEEGFASNGVWCGMDVSANEWRSLMEKAKGNHYILQKFCRRYTIPVLKCGEDEMKDYCLMLGIFQTNGHASCFYNRAGNAGVIDYSHGCVCVGAAAYSMQ